MQKKFTISVIMPIYNVEDYLREAVDSVINQTVGFEDNIQLVLINDGSTDSSEEICKEYKEKYPDNITYIYKENGGVSSARNMGFDLVEGKYVTFLDPDDKWEENSFLNAYNFFEKHYDEIDVLAARIQFFEAKNDYHSLDYKFENGTRVADLNDEEELYSVQSTAATTFIKAEAIGDTRFDSRLKYGEDSTFINKMMLKKCKYGLINEALYYYRRRVAGDSAVNNQVLDKSFYLNSLKYYHLELFKYSKELYGKVIPYAQSMVGYDIMWRFSNPEMPNVLDADEKDEYLELLKEILSQVDDRILLRHPRHKSIAKKYDAILYKYGVDMFKNSKLDRESGEIQFNGYRIIKVTENKSNCTKCVRAAVEDGYLYADILIAKWLLRCTENGAEYYLKYKGKRIDAFDISEYRVNTHKTSENEHTFYYMLYRFAIPVNEMKKGETLKLDSVFSFSGEEIEASLNYGKFVPAAVRFGTIYKWYGDYTVRCFRTAIKVTLPKSKGLEKLCGGIKNILCLVKRRRLDVIFKRYVLYPFYKFTERNKGKIWLISDRIDNAGDNGEVLFKYICEHCPEGVRPIFVIGDMAKPEVKQRLRSIGEVAIAESRKYPYLFLMADKIISSSAGEFTINAFDDQRHYFIDLYNYTYYFMNHGVNCGDCSKWLNKYNKDIHIFFTTGESERRNIIERDYNLEPEQVVITGLARFDALYDDPKKQLLILPTWRRAYKQCYDDKTSSIYFEGFKNTDFFKFYNGLITDERLLDVMRRKGYTGLFCLHPIFAKQSAHFKDSDVFKINEGFVDYNKAFAESTVMVTDYSTIAFDFAYLNKPIVYTQFDKKEFYENQIYDECFDYDNEGFGPVCEDLDSAVNALCELIENDCENKYLDRIDSFFVNHDKNNAKRILEAVLEDDRKMHSKN